VNDQRSSSDFRKHKPPAAEDKNSHLGVRWAIYTFAAMATAATIVLMTVDDVFRDGDDAVSAAATIGFALLALFAFLTDKDPAFGVFPDIAKAIAVGVALPLAILSSGADLTATGSWILAGLYLVLASVTFILKLQAKWRSSGDPGESDPACKKQNHKEPEQPSIP